MNSVILAGMRNYDVSLADIAAMPPGADKAIQLAVYGLLTSETHHKQWFLEQILTALGEDPASVRDALHKLDYDCDPGIPP